MTTITNTSLKKKYKKTISKVAHICAIIVTIALLSYMTYQLVETIYFVKQI